MTFKLVNHKEQPIKIETFGFIDKEKRYFKNTFVFYSINEELKIIPGKDNIQFPVDIKKFREVLPNDILRNVNRFFIEDSVENYYTFKIPEIIIKSFRK